MRNRLARPGAAAVTRHPAAAEALGLVPRRRAAAASAASAAAGAAAAGGGFDKGRAGANSFGSVRPIEVELASIVPARRRRALAATAAAAAAAGLERNNDVEASSSSPSSSSSSSPSREKVGAGRRN